MYIVLIEEMMKDEEKDHIWLPSGNYLIGEAVREWVKFSVTNLDSFLVILILFFFVENYLSKF